MSPETILAAGRVSERLLVCVFAGSSLGFGWNLFRVGVVNDQSAEFRVKDWRANLKHVGPGVFFALFGATVLAISLRSPLSLLPASCPSCDDKSTKQTQPASSVDAKMKLVYVDGSDPSVVKGWVASINTLQQIVKPTKFQGLTERIAVSKSLDDLTELRDTLVIQHFGADIFQEYKDARQKTLNGMAISDKQKQRVSAIDEWMRSNRILE